MTGRVGAGVLASAVVLGLLGDALFDGQAARPERGRSGRSRSWSRSPRCCGSGTFRSIRGAGSWSAPLVCSSRCCSVWRDSPLLQAVNVFAIAGAVALGALRRTDRRVVHAEVDDYVAGAVTAGAATMLGAVELMQREVPWQEIRRRTCAVRASTAVARGFALGLPLLVLFGVLFVAGRRRLPESPRLGRARSSARLVAPRRAHPRDRVDLRRPPARSARDEGERARPLGARDTRRASAPPSSPSRSGADRPALPRLRARSGAIPLRRSRSRRSAGRSHVRRVRAARVLRARRCRGRLVLPLLLAVDVAARGTRRQIRTRPRRSPACLDSARRRRDGLGSPAPVAVPAGVRPHRASHLRDRRRPLARRGLRVVCRNRASRPPASVRDRCRRRRIRCDVVHQRRRIPTR